MNHGPLIFLGLFATFAWSWFSLVLKPQNELGTLEPFRDEVSGQIYPINRAGTAQQGRDIYRANGCAVCHTQQVRSSESGSDIERGWGIEGRPTVARDFLFDQPALPGTFRVGPDLANVANRHDAKWQFAHLYNARITSPGSSMPPYPFLFQKRKVRGAMSPEAIDAGKYGPGEGYEIIPGDQARAVVAYLQSLRTDNYIFEVPNPHPSTNAPAGGDTNAPAAGSNSVPAQAAPAK
jgi:cytochrome c oxidase cbb3-type subunit 2